MLYIPEWFKAASPIHGRPGELRDGIARCDFRMKNSVAVTPKRDGRGASKNSKTDKLR